MADAKTIFISYSSLDAKTADRVIRLLQQMKISYWKAPEMIPAGSSYAREIPKAIRECTLFLLIVSQASQDSIWVEKEVDTAIHFRRTILPLRIDNAPLNDMFQFYLNNVQAISYNNNAAAAFQALQQRIEFLLASAREKRPEDSSRVQAKVPKGSSKVQAKQTGAIRGTSGSRPETQAKSVKASEGRSGAGTNAMKKSSSKAQLQQEKNTSEETQQSSGDDSKFRFNPYRGTQSLTMNRRPYRCQYCGSNVRNISRGVYQCVECGKETYDDFQTIRNYLDKVGPTPALTIEADTGVPLKNIEFFLREEYLEIPKLSSIRLACERCGSPIRTGYLCELCKRSESAGTVRQTSSGAWRTRKRN